MKVKTSELEGVALDASVSLALGHDELDARWSPSTDWFYGGGLIESLCVEITPLDRENGSEWQAQTWQPFGVSTGCTPLVAAMRAIVSSVIGDEVDLPEELSPCCA